MLFFLSKYLIPLLPNALYNSDSYGPIVIIENCISSFALIEKDIINNKIIRKSCLFFFTIYNYYKLSFDIYIF